MTIKERVNSEIPVREPLFVIQPSKGWGTLALNELWDYRGLIWSLTAREIKGKYRQMALGPLWIILIPLANMVVFSVIFGTLARMPSDDIPYPIFTYTALLPWTYFANAARGSVSSLLSNIGLISKVYFHRLVIPIASVISGLVDLAISFLILLGMMAFFGYPPTLKILLLPLLILLAALTSLAVGLWNTALAVRFRDMSFAINFVIQFWMYATPVAYTSSVIPEKWLVLYQMNPLYWVVEGFRWALLGKELVWNWALWASLGVVVFALISGAFVFRKAERTVVDLI